VFDKDHKLLSLPELKSYIEGNHHLPDMPTAGDVAISGLDLGEINKVLVKTVEKLTLHLIEKNEELKILKLHVERVSLDHQRQIDELKKMILVRSENQSKIGKL